MVGNTGSTDVATFLEGGAGVSAVACTNSLRRNEPTMRRRLKPLWSWPRRSRAFDTTTNVLMLSTGHGALVRAE